MKRFYASLGLFTSLWIALAGFFYVEIPGVTLIQTLQAGFVFAFFSVMCMISLFYFVTSWVNGKDG